MQLLFLRSGKVGSRLIRWILGEPVSHVAILFSPGVVVHATFSGVQMDYITNFLRTHEVVYRVDMPSGARGELDTLCELLGRYWGRGYDWGGALYLGYAHLMHRWFRRELPTKNEWDSPYKPFCAELAEAATGWTVDPMITPYELYLQVQMEA